MNTAILYAPIARYLLAAALSWSPLADHAYTRVAPEDTLVRYESIAADLETVVLDPHEDPLFEGPTGRAQTALLMLAIASYESGGFRADVDRQDRPTGDGGHAWCLAQLHDEAPAHYARGLTDRVSCFRGMLRALRDSWSMCATDRWDPAYRITGYTVGTCTVNEPQAVHRVKRAMAWWAMAPWLPPLPPDA